MIVRSKPSVWELVFFWRLSVLPRIAGHLVAVFAFSCAVVWVVLHRPAWFRGFSPAPFTLLGIALSIFLGFRNSACYDRWWEARRQLGGMIGDMRSFARLVTTLTGAETAAQQQRRSRLVLGVIGYTYALIAHLRGREVEGVSPRYFPEDNAWRAARNGPDALLRSLAREYAAMLSEGEIDSQLFRSIEERTTAIASVQVACERIRGTPTPFTYTLLLHRTAHAFCFLLPFGLAPSMGFATPVLCTLVAYAFFGLDALGDELEEPFGASLNALPLDSMARTVEISLLEALGEATPEPIEPVDSVLR